MKAIILGAGKGIVRQNEEDSIPKCLITDPFGQRVLDWILDSLKQVGIHHVIFVGGFHLEKVIPNYPNLKYYINFNWEHTGMVESLSCARSELDSPFLVSYSALGRFISQNNNLLGVQGLHQDSLQRTLLLPLSYSFIESFDGPFLKIVHPFFYISFLLVFYYRTTDLISRKKQAILLTCVLAATPIIWWHSTLSFNNLATGYYFSIGTFFVFSGMLKKDRPPGNYMLLAGLFYAFSLWTRLEFLFYFLIPLLIVVHFSIKTGNFRLPFYLAGFPFALGVFWSFYTHLISQITAGHSYNDVLALLTMAFILMVHTRIYKYVGKHAKPSRLPAWMALAIDLKKTFAAFCSMRLKSVIIIPLVLLFILGEFKILETVFPAANYYLVSAESRFFQTLMQHSYWIFTNGLLLIFLFRWFSFSREIKYIFFLLLSLVVFHNLLYMTLAPGKMFGRGVFEIVRLHLFFPGSYLNGSSSRELISFYPIVIFGAGIYLSNFSGNRSEKNRIEKRFEAILKTIILLNSVVLLFLFYIPKLDFVLNHYGKTEREIRLSAGSRDMPNAFRKANQWAYRVKDLTPGNSAIIIPKEYSLGVFSMVNILLPRKTIWFEEETQPNPSVYVQEGERPLYAITADGWEPLVPFEIIESFKHEEFEVSLVKILNDSPTNPH